MANSSSGNNTRDTGQAPSMNATEEAIYAGNENTFLSRLERITPHQSLHMESGISSAHTPTNTISARRPEEEKADAITPLSTKFSGQNSVLIKKRSEQRSITSSSGSSVTDTNSKSSSSYCPQILVNI